MIIIATTTTATTMSVICESMHICYSLYAEEVKEQHAGAESLLPCLHGLWGSKSGDHNCTARALPPQPPLQPISIIYSLPSLQ